MNLTVLKPGHPATFFHALAQIDEHLLLQAATALGVRQDFVSMQGLLDFIDGEGKSLGLFLQTKGALVLVPADAHSTECQDKDKHATLVRALVRPLQSIDMKEIDPSSHQPMNAQALAYAERLASTLKSLPEDVRQSSLDLALFEACNLVRDGRVFDALITAGANPTCSDFKSRGKDTHNHDLDDVAMPFEEAMRHGNYTGALAIGKHLDPGWVHDTITRAVQNPKGESKMPMDFAWQPMVWPMIKKLSSEQDTEDLARLLSFMTSQCQAHEAQIAIDEPQKSISRDRPDNVLLFHASLLAGYLYEKNEKSTTAWTEASIGMAAGPGGLEPDGDLARWITTRFCAGAQASDVTAYLTKQALMTHCPPVLALCEPVLKSVAALAPNKKTKGPNRNFGINFSLAVFNEATEPRVLVMMARPPTDANRFRDTLIVMQAAGYDINATFVPANIYQKLQIPVNVYQKTQNGSIPSTVLSVCANDTADEMHKKLPILLSLGADPLCKDANGQTVDSVIRSQMKDAGKVQTWSHAIDTYRARLCAQMALSAIEDFENEPSSTAKISTAKP